MSESHRENPQSFKEFIGLNQPMTPYAASRKLETWFDISETNVLVWFPYLKDFQGTIEFKEGSFPSFPRAQKCIIMEGKTPEGKPAWEYKLDSEGHGPIVSMG